MTIKQLLYFSSICRTGNMTRAAEENFVSQPALSFSIKELEIEVGMPLFFRQGKRLIPTDAGMSLNQEIEILIKQYAHIEGLVENGALMKKYIRLGFSSVVGSNIAPEICQYFRASHPEIEIRTEENHGANLMRALEQEGLDVVITGAAYGYKSEWNGKFSMIPLPNAGLVYCTSTNNPLVQKENVTIQDIAEEPVAMLTPNFHVSVGIEKRFLDAGYPLNIVLRSSQMYTIEHFIIEGYAGGFLPSNVCQGNQRIQVISCPEVDHFLVQDAAVFWKKKEVLAPAVEEFIKTVKCKSVALGI